MNKLGTKLGAIAMSATMALTFAPSTLFTLAAETDDALISTETVPVYRFYNPNSGEHVWSTSEDEGTLLVLAGWTAEDLGNGTNIAWYAPTTGDQVYRLYNPNVFDAAGNQIGDHVYTTSADEKNSLVAAGWSLDESNFYSALATDSSADGIYRAYNPYAYELGQSGAHHFTMSETEYSGLGAIGWTLEGVKLLGYAEDIDQELSVELSSTTPKVGDTLKAIVTGADVVTYSWTADGEVVGTEEDLDITSDMLGKKIQVKVTALDGETVKSEESAPVVYETPDIVTAVRKAANSFTLTFDSAADEIVKADDIEVISEDLTDVKKITGLDFYGDGTTAVVTVSTSFKDGVTYNVNYGDSTASFVASVGEVAKIVIATSEAEVNTKTAIEFALFDENGVDVTSAIKVDETCTVTFEGDYDNYENTKASKSTVTMVEAGDVCTVTVEYDKNDGETERVTASKEITCVPAGEKKGTPFFKVTPGAEINWTDNCFRFYNPANSTDTNVSVPVDLTKSVHFYAQDADKSAINYDSYEIESADETIATATIVNATGKWASFDVSANTKGSVLLTLTATRNGASTTYEIPVTVTDKAAPVRAKLSLTKPTMSNAWDEYYSGEATVTVYAADGTEADTDLYTTDAPTLKTTGKGIDQDLKGQALYETAFARGDAGFQLAGTTYTAYAAEAGGYVIEAEVTDLTTGNVITARNTVNVKELPKEAWRTSDNVWKLYAPRKFTDAGEDGLDDVTNLTESEHYALPWIDDAEYGALEATTNPQGTLNNPGDVTLKATISGVTTEAYAFNAATATGGAIAFLSLDDEGNFDAALADADAIKTKAAPTSLKDAKTIAKATKITPADGAPVDATDFDMEKLTFLKPEDIFTTDGMPDYSCIPGKNAYALAAEFYSGDGVKANYAIELDDADKKLGYTSTTSTMEARLAATMGGLFAGYVHEDGSIGDGYVIANRASRIINSTWVNKEVRVQTYFGKLLVPEVVTPATAMTPDVYTTPLYGVGQYGALAENDARDADTDELLNMNFVTYGDGNADGRYDLYTAQKDQVLYDDDYAKEGTYKVEFSFWTAGASKITKESAAFSVKNNLFVPTVTVKSQTLESYDYPDGWADAVVTDVDLNNNDPTSYSVVELEDKTGIQISDSKTPAKWAVVFEQGVYFHKPLDRTFKLN